MHMAFDSHSFKFMLGRQRRPEGMVSTLAQKSIKCATGYVEVKSEIGFSNTANIHKDLQRLANCCKAAKDIELEEAATVTTTKESIISRRPQPPPPTASIIKSLPPESSFSALSSDKTTIAAGLLSTGSKVEKIKNQDALPNYLKQHHHHPNHL